MLNILQTEEKKKVLVEYRLRLAVVSILATGALILSSLVLLAPSYFLAVSKFNNAEEQLSTLEKKYGNATQEKELGAQIRDINNKISLLLSSDDGARLAPSQAISNILSLKGNEVKIYSLTYDSTANQERIVLTGIARDRDSLAQLVETLKKDPTFTSVTLPISSYVKSTNIDFSLVVERRSKPQVKK